MGGRGGVDGWPGGAGEDRKEGREDDRAEGRE